MDIVLHNNRWYANDFVIIVGEDNINRVYPEYMETEIEENEDYKPVFSSNSFEECLKWVYTR